MNSTTNRDALNRFMASKYTLLQVDLVDDQQIGFEVEHADVQDILSTLKQKGWKQLSYLSAVDWIDENKFELVYLLFNWDTPVYVQIRTKIDRDNPVTQSICPIYPGAKYYERETHEFFGIKFEGNPDYHKQLILENWDDLPPLRKDFDPQAYSDKTFPKRSYDHDFEVTDKNNQRKAKREARAARANSLRGGQTK